MKSPLCFKCSVLFAEGGRLITKLEKTKRYSSVDSTLYTKSWRIGNVEGVSNTTWSLFKLLNWDFNLQKLYHLL